MQTTTSRAMARALPLPCGNFVPFVRHVRTTGTRSLSQTLRAGQACATAAAALRLARRKARALDGDRRR